jgi:hypothetical protein
LRAYASFLVRQTERLIDLGPGDFIGRSPLATLCVDDPRASEAHAMLSLRGRELMLLSLRGRFRVDGKVVPELALRPEVSIEIVPGYVLDCLDVVLPSVVLAVEVPGLPPFVLGGTTSLWVDPARISRGFDASADAVFWALGSEWRVTASGNVREVEAGIPLEIAGVTVQCIAMNLGRAAFPRTQKEPRGPTTWIACGHGVRLSSANGPDVVIGGIPGRLLDTLLRIAPTMHWRNVADHVWPADASIDHSLRKRFDVALGRLRDKLAPHVGDDVVTLDGSGMVVFNLPTADDIAVQS